jgi:hypothetical protein
MPQLLQMLHSTRHYRVSQIPDLDTYIQNRIRLANYDREGLTIKVAEIDDFQQITATLDKFRDRTRITERTGRGDLCVVAYKHGALAHVRWAALNPLPLPVLGGYMMHLQSDEAYTYDSYTVPTFRRQGIASEARIVLTKQLVHNGVHCAYTDSRLDNVHNQQTWRKRVREGRQRIIGIITVNKRLGRTQCKFFAETGETHPLIARLYDVSPHQVQIRSIYQFLDEKQPA